MPAVKIDGRKFIIRWTPEMDEKIFWVSKRYIKLRKNSFVVDWKTAFQCGEFDEFPIKNVNLISGRFHNLTFKKNHPKLYKKRLREKNKNRHLYKKQYITWRRKLHDVWNNMPLEDKLKHGYKPRDIWTKAQKRILFNLARKYCKRNNRIKWKELIKDKKISRIPERYQKDFNKLRYYYWSIVSGEKLYNEKKLSNKKYMERNKEKWCELLRKREKMIREGVSEYLNKRIKEEYKN